MCAQRRGAALPRACRSVRHPSRVHGGWEDTVRDTKRLAQTCAAPFEVFTAELQQPAQEENKRSR